MPSLKFPNPRDRDTLERSGFGVITEPWGIECAVSASIAVSGTVYAVLVGLRAGDVAASASVGVTVVGATLTLTKVGLYDTAGNRLAASAESSATFTPSTGIKTVAFATPYTVPTDGAYYATFVCVGTTPPTMLRGSTSLFFPGIAGGAARIAAQTGQTDLAATHTLSAAAGLPYWIAIS